MAHRQIGIHNRQFAICILWVLLLATSGCSWLRPEEPAAPTSSSDLPTATATPPSSTLTPSTEPDPTATPQPTSTPRPTFTPTPTPVMPTATPATTTPAPATTTPASATPPTLSPADLAEQYPELAAILNNPELHAAYKEVLVAYQQGGEQAAMEMAQRYGLLTPEGGIRATLVLDTLDMENTTALVAQLEAAGITVVSAEGDRIEIAVPMELIQAQAQAGQPGAIFIQLVQLEHVIGMLPPW